MSKLLLIRAVGRKMLEKKIFRNIVGTIGQLKVTVRMLWGKGKLSQCVKYFYFEFRDTEI